MKLNEIQITYIYRWDQQYKWYKLLISEPLPENYGEVFIFIRFILFILPFVQF